MLRAIALFVAATLLTGCARTAHKPATDAGVGSASYRTADRGLAHYQLALGQVATGATVAQRIPPVYPAALLAACLPQVELPARIIVDQQGGVREVRMNPPPGQTPFADAVRQAVRGWRYAPLTITRWAADAQGDSHPVDSATKPFSLDYVFTFRCEHGHTAVSSGAQPTAR